MSESFDKSFLPREYETAFESVCATFKADRSSLIEVMRWARLSSYRGIPASVFMAHVLAVSLDGKELRSLCGRREQQGWPWETRLIRDLIPRRLVTAIESKGLLDHIEREVEGSNLFEVQCMCSMVKEDPEPNPEGYFESYLLDEPDRLLYFENEAVFIARYCQYGKPEAVSLTDWTYSIIGRIEAYGLKVMDFALLKDWRI